jgi:hypothetical protein
MRGYAAIVLVLIAATALAGEATAPAAHNQNIVKRAAKDMKHSVKAGWKDAKATFKEAGKDFGRGTAHLTKQVGREMQESARKTKAAAKEGLAR